MSESLAWKVRSLRGVRAQWWVVLNTHLTLPEYEALEKGDFVPPLSALEELERLFQCQQGLLQQHRPLYARPAASGQ